MSPRQADTAAAIARLVAGAYEEGEINGRRQALQDCLAAVADVRDPLMAAGADWSARGCSKEAGEAWLKAAAASSVASKVKALLDADSDQLARRECGR